MLNYLLHLIGNNIQDSSHIGRFVNDYLNETGINNNLLISDLLIRQLQLADIELTYLVFKFQNKL